ncbi:Uncharacterised protein [Klebsiella michiganensis]|uniref:Uncharacterized protein n=1 Tax=Klebsiella michiganensis TaxID=1134687 RepID=A0A7H4PJ36_9ENTR|nr:Uncharacterised protein [Klebsiella michiganensis]
MEYINHRVREFGGHLTNDMDAFRLQLPQVSKSFLVHNRSLSQIYYRSLEGV